MVFIHRSIKTRIETINSFYPSKYSSMFLYIDPLKQGLKHFSTSVKLLFNWFLYIDPLKQGLKLKIIFCNLHKYVSVFIHRSIKTRIETHLNRVIYLIYRMFLYIDPLKQGLKQPLQVSFSYRSYLFLYIDPLKQGLKHFSP